MAIQAVSTIVSSNQPIATVALSQLDLIPRIEAKQGQWIVLTTSFIHQQINMGLDDLICRLSKQLAGIVKLMVKNEVRNMHAQELRSIHPVHNSTMLCHFDWGSRRFT